MSDRVTYDAAMRTLPGVLKKSESTLPLGQTTAKALQGAEGNTILASIYARIDELPEELLDILAVDFGVDWYDYDYDLATKRRVIQESFYVHQHLGTVGAVKRALSAVWPNTDVEEWFDYGGDPYYFRVLLNAGDSTQPIPVDEIIDTIRTYQSVRSHLEDAIPVIRITFNIVIGTDMFTHVYHVPVCGTNPRVANHGAKQDSGLTVGVDCVTAEYHVRPCGTSLNALM